MQVHEQLAFKYVDVAFFRKDDVGNLQTGVNPLIKGVIVFVRFGFICRLVPLMNDRIGVSNL